MNGFVILLWIGLSICISISDLELGLGFDTFLCLLSLVTS